MILLVSTMISYGGIHPASADQFVTPTVAVDPVSIASFIIQSGDVVTFAVDVANAPAINGFNVALTYDTNVLQGQSVDLTGNVLSTTGKIPITLANCVDFTGTCPSPGGAPGVVHVAQLILGGLTGAPTSGLLFTVSFTVKGGFSQIHVQTASLSNGSTAGPVSPLVTYDGYFTNIDCPRGSGVLCQPPTVVFTWSPSRPIVGVAAVFDASQSQGPSPGVMITRYFWTWGEPGPYSSTLLCLDCPNQENPNALPLNSTVEHQYSSICNCTVTLTVTDTDGISWSTSNVIDVLPVPPPDFTMQFSPLPFTIPADVIQGKPFTQIVRLNSTNGFGGMVSLTVSLIPLYNQALPNVTLSIAPSTLFLNGGSNLTVLTISAQGNPRGGEAQVVVSASSGTVSHSITLPFYVFTPTFELSCDAFPGTPCTYQFVPIGGTITFPVFLGSRFGFHDTVNLTGSSQNLTFHVSPSSVQLEANQTTVLKTTISASSQTMPGAYFVSVTGSSLGVRPQTLDIPVIVDMQRPSYFSDLQVDAPAHTSLHAGTNATIAVSITSLNGFTGRVGLLGSFVPFVTEAPSTPTIRPATPTILGRLSIAAGESRSTGANVSTTFATTPGSYTLAIGVFGVNYTRFWFVEHWVLTEVNILPPALSPLIGQFHWKHQVSLSIRGLGAGTETFTAGLYNPNNSTTLYARIIITGTDQTGTKTFTTGSEVETVMPQQFLTNIQVRQAFNQSAVGSTFTFRVIITWGVYPTALSQTSTISSGPAITGSFRIVS